MEHKELKNSEKISEALKLLEEAAIGEKDELKSVISDKYTHLRDFFVETECSLVKSLSDAGKHAVKEAAHAKDVSFEKARELADEIDKNVRHNPWPYIASSAAAGLVFGYILDRKRR
jgi:ElaB/YqjD/DUF883 family membrane-anchored ribosome-binding protein